LNDVDTRVVDLLAYLDDAADGFSDLYTIISATTDYMDLAKDYGEFRYRSYKIEFAPHFIYSGNAGDYAVGVAAVNQGVFTIGSAVPNAASVVNIPGSRVVTNKNFWTFGGSIKSEWFSSSATNTATSVVPKVTFYHAWQIPTSTTPLLGLIHFRVIIDCRVKLH